MLKQKLQYFGHLNQVFGQHNMTYNNASACSRKNRWGGKNSKC